MGTITNVTWWWAHHPGPHSYGAELFGVFSDNTNRTEVRAVRSTDGGATWTEPDAVNRPTYPQQIKALWSHSVGSTIHVTTIHAHNGTTSRVHYHTFDMATNVWSIANELILDVNNIGQSITAGTEPYYGVSVAARADGTVVVLYPATARVAGKDWTALHLARRAAGGGWTTDIVVRAAATDNNYIPRAVTLNEGRSRVHIDYSSDYGGAIPWYAKTLRADNTLSAETNVSALGPERPFHPGAAFNDGVSRCAQGAEGYYVEWADADSPTYTAYRFDRLSGMTNPDTACGIAASADTAFVLFEGGSETGGTIAGARHSQPCGNNELNEFDFRGLTASHGSTTFTAGARIGTNLAFFYRTDTSAVGEMEYGQAPVWGDADWQQVAPDGTIIGGQWSITGAPTHNEAVNEPCPDAADYLDAEGAFAVPAGGVSGIVKFSLPPLTDPSGVSLEAVNHWLHVVTRRDGTGASTALRVYVYQAGTELGNFVINMTSSGISTPPYGSQAKPIPASIASLITNYADLELGFQYDNTSGTGGGDARIHWVRLFVPAAAPVTGKIKRWDGTTWVPDTFTVWDGIAWVAKPCYRWDGTVWQPVT